MTEFTFAPDDTEYAAPSPERSTILFQIVMDDGEVLIEEIQYEGGSAEIENEAGMLTEAVKGLLDTEHERDGWWVIEGFYGSYTKDYYGEVDCDFECDLIRPAGQADYDKFGVGP